MHPTDALKMMSKEQLLATLPRLAAGERAQLVVLLDYLGELGERCAYEEAGYSSLWDYARRALLYLEMQASLRTKAARAIRRKPERRAMLADGRLSLCTLCTLELCRTHNHMLARQTFPDLVPPRRSHASRMVGAPRQSPGDVMRSAPQQSPGN